MNGDAFWWKFPNVWTWSWVHNSIRRSSVKSHILHQCAPSFWWSKFCKKIYGTIGHHFTQLSGCCLRSSALASAWMHAGGYFTAANFSSAHRSHITEAKDSPHRKRLWLITAVPGLRGVTTSVKGTCLATRSQGSLSPVLWYSTISKDFEGAG